MCAHNSALGKYELIELRHACQQYLQAIKNAALFYTKNDCQLCLQHACLLILMLF